MGFLGPLVLLKKNSVAIATCLEEFNSLAPISQQAYNSIAYFIQLQKLDTGIEIISINRGRSDQKSATDDKEYRLILITCKFGKIEVEQEKFLGDLEATGYVDNPTIIAIDHTQRKLKFEIRHTPGALVAALEVLAVYYFY